MDDCRETNSLCQGLSWREWDKALGFGRHTGVPPCTWLEAFSRDDETTAIFLSGRVGLRAIHECEDVDGDVVPFAAPAVLSLCVDRTNTHAHWVLSQSTVCFFTAKSLQASFAASAGFACNFVDVLQRQMRHHLDHLSQAEDGLSRLSASLLSRCQQTAHLQRKVHVTQSELAMETGLSRQWVNQLLRQLEHQGIAQRGRGCVVLNAPARLAEMSRGVVS